MTQKTYNIPEARYISLIIAIVIIGLISLLFLYLNLRNKLNYQVAEINDKTKQTVEITNEETLDSIKNKLGTASASSDGYLSALDWEIFDNKQDVLEFTPVADTVSINGKMLSENIILTTADILEAQNKKYLTDSMVVSLGNQSGINTGDEVQTTIRNKLGVATATTDGYLTALDWAKFNANTDSVGLGLDTQYLRGDKTWVTLNQSAVAGLTTVSSPGFNGLTIANTILVNGSNTNAEIMIGGLPSSPGTMAGLWFGQTTPDDTNYAILGNKDHTYINTPANDIMYMRVGNVDMARIGDFSTLYPGLTDPLVFDIVQRMYVTANSNNWAGAIIENDGTGPILDLRNTSQATIAMVHQDGRYEGPAISMGATTGDKISLFSNYLGTAANYGFGVENNFLYYKSGSTGHRWYIGANADGGTTDYMELTAAGLSVYGSITPGGYNSADGSAGITNTTTVKGSDGNNCNMTFKNGILTAETCP